MKFPVYIFTIIFVFISCNNIGGKNIENIPKDTINMPENICVEKNSLEKVQGYKNKYGITFSNYYQDEPLSFDFDKNKTIDTIVVLKPYYENGKGDCYPENLDSHFPILLISKTINKKSKIFKILKNVLKCSTPAYYEEITTNKTGFIISKDLIGNNGFYTKTYVSFKYNNFYVDSIYVESWGWHQYEKTIRLRNKAFELSRYKRTDIDSIRKILDKQ